MKNWKRHGMKALVLALIMLQGMSAAGFADELKGVTVDGYSVYESESHTVGIKDSAAPEAPIFNLFSEEDTQTASSIAYYLPLYLDGMLQRHVLVSTEALIQEEDLLVAAPPSGEYVGPDGISYLIDANADKWLWGSAIESATNAFTIANSGFFGINGVPASDVVAVSAPAFFHTVTFTGIVQGSDETMPLGEVIVANGASAMAPEAPDGYKITGSWSLSTDNITETTEATVQLAKLSQSHTVTFEYYINASSTQTSTQVSAEHGQAAVPPSITQSAGHRVGYTFTGWDADISSITSDMTVTAQYEPKQYSVRFVGKDGEVIGESLVEYRGSAVAPTPPALEGSTFSYWTPSTYGNVTQNMTIRAIYSEKRFYVFFYDLDPDRYVSYQQIIQGRSATAPVLPQHEGYTFLRWDKDFSSITGETRVNAVYDVSAYSITFESESGDAVLLQKSVEYGGKVVPPAAPAKAGHTFVEWKAVDGDSAYTYVTGAATFRPAYAINTYAATFYDGDGAVFHIVDGVEHGASITEAIPVPQKAGYRFDGWSISLSNITSPRNVYPVFTPEMIDVTFVYYLGEDSQPTETVLPVANGGKAVPPENAADRNHRTGYMFTGWDHDLENVTEAMTVTAQYAVQKYQVVYQDDTGRRLSMQQIPYGGNASAPADPVKTGHVFEGWDHAGTDIRQDRLITARFSPEMYSVSFVVYGGEPTTQSIAYGERAQAPSHMPAHPYMVFDRWDKSFDFVQADMTVTAKYRPFDVTVRFTLPVYEGEAAKDVLIDTRKADLNEHQDGYSVSAPDGYVWAIDDTTFANVQDGDTVDVHAATPYCQVIIADSVSGGQIVRRVRQGDRLVLVPDVHDGYTFERWDINGEHVFDGERLTVSGALAVTALYTKNEEQAVFYIQYRAEDGTVLYRQPVLAGESVNAPPASLTPPSVDGQSFVRWDAEYPVTPSQDMDVQAVYAPWPMVTFVDADGLALERQLVAPGAHASYAGVLPAHDGETFAGWLPNPEDIPISEDTRFVAQYKANPQYHVVVSYRFENGETAHQPEERTLRQGETFSIVSPQIEGYTADVEVVSGTAGEALVRGIAGTETSPVTVPFHVTYMARTDTKYTVHHYRQAAGTTLGSDVNNQDLSAYMEPIDEEFTAPTQSEVTLTPKQFAGFAPLAGQNLTYTVAADGSMEASIFYERESYPIHFRMDGGAPVETIWVAYDQPISQAMLPENPERPGYVFDGWKQAVPSRMPAKEVVLEARWTTGTECTYTINLWVENADLAEGEEAYGYTYHSAITANGLADTEIVLEMGSDMLPALAHFTFDRADAGKTIAGDGSTIVNAYYARQSYTITFNLGYAKDMVLKMGDTYRAGEAPYTITARYGQKIGDKWPTAENMQLDPEKSGATEQFFAGWNAYDTAVTYVSKRTSMTDDLCAEGGKTVYAQWSQSTVTSHLHYMFESLTGEGAPYVHGGREKLYEEDTAYSQVVKTNSTSFTNKQIPGMRGVGTVTMPANEDGSHDVYLYYDRTDVSLTFMDQGTIVKVVPGLRIGESLEVQNHTPPHPAALDDTYSFDGWFTNTTFDEIARFEWTGVKVTGDLILYAGYVAKE